MSMMYELSCDDRHMVCAECFSKFPRQDNFRCPLGCAYGCRARPCSLTTPPPSHLPSHPHSHSHPPSPKRARKCLCQDSRVLRRFGEVIEVDDLGRSSTTPVVTEYVVTHVVSSKFGMYRLKSLRTGYETYHADSSVCGEPQAAPIAKKVIVCVAPYKFVVVKNCLPVEAAAVAARKCGVPLRNCSIEDAHYGCSSCRGPLKDTTDTWCKCTLCSQEVCACCVVNNFGWCRMCAALRDSAQGQETYTSYKWRVGEWSKIS